LSRSQFSYHGGVLLITVYKKNRVFFFVFFCGEQGWLGFFRSIGFFIFFIHHISCDSKGCAEYVEYNSDVVRRNMCLSLLKVTPCHDICCVNLLRSEMVAHVSVEKNVPSSIPASDIYQGKVKRSADKER